MGGAVTVINKSNKVLNRKIPPYTLKIPKINQLYDFALNKNMLPENSK